MVLEVSVEVIPEPVIYRANPEYLHDLFTVRISDDSNKRILTVVTDNDDVASKWLKEVLRSTKASNTKPAASRGSPSTFSRDSIFVALLAEEETEAYSRPYEPIDHTYDLLTLCVGSHCLMYELPNDYHYTWWRYDEPAYADAPKSVKAFFQSPRVVVLGLHMAKVAKRLEARHGIEIKNPVDLNELAVKGMPERYDLDLARYNFEKLTMTVLGKRFDVVKPEKVHWYPQRRYGYGWNTNRDEHIDYDKLSHEKIMFNTVDAYLHLLICFKLVEAMDGPDESSSSSSSKKKKKKKKKDKKKITKRSQ